MSRWKELPERLDSRVRQLVVQLRRLKDRGGLSLSSLATRTGYSRSSWERYLNGKALPPRDAVEGLARAAGADPTRLLVLHELAEEAWGRGTDEDGGTGTDGGTEADAAREPTPDHPSQEHPSEDHPSEDHPSPDHPSRDPSPDEDRRPRGPVALIAALVMVLAAAAVALLAVAPWRDDGARGAGEPTRGPHGSASFAPTPGRTYSCEVRREGGLLYAGHSTTRDAILQMSTAGWDVAEAQCLLRRHGFDPGGVDGVFGDRTERAVKRFQKRSELVVDGKVGPHTWKALRG
ncbi:peptidoglycan-binding protein [Streptomyces sp. SAJ15]|uniref:peptidoglycan-binding protein n=1 Tax=Streptomyces sp. SAJ15 TaxID=2011095 RepID=UPI0011860518|nr:peptidoglycan-binding protein [Streptomyces sp. SAJ15]TVL90118.1 peptidoglycan-binding protein [Streptomyces sp. SAJ15]